MAVITLRGKPITTTGELPAVGTKAPHFTLVDSKLNDVTLEQFKGQKIVLNIFPSIDTPVCAMSTRNFNERSNQFENTKVLCISLDLPFAQSRFCELEKLHNVVTASSFRSNFGENYGVEIKDGGMRGLLSRAIVVIDESGVITYTQQVNELSEHPDYDAVCSHIE